MAKELSDQTLYILRHFATGGRCGDLAQKDPGIKLASIRRAPLEMLLLAEEKSEKNVTACRIFEENTKMPTSLGRKRRN